jgi:hypothetical protein
MFDTVNVIISNPNNTITNTKNHLGLNKCRLMEVLDKIIKIVIHTLSTNNDSLMMSQFTPIIGINKDVFVTLKFKLMVKSKPTHTLNSAHLFFIAINKHITVNNTSLNIEGYC